MRQWDQPQLMNTTNARLLQGFAMLSQQDGKGGKERRECGEGREETDVGAGNEPTDSLVHSVP